MKRSQRGLGRPSLSGMLATRQGAMVLALVCAACAAGVMLFALSGYKHGVQKATVVPSQATVLVATGAIQKGTSGDVVAADSLYKSTPVAASQLSPGAISDAAVLKGKFAQSDVLPGQQLTTADFSSVASVTALLSPTQRAVSVPTEEVHGDLDVLIPGDRVDLYSSFVQGAQTAVALLEPNVLVLKTPGSVALGAPVAPTKAGAAPAAGTTMVFQISSSVAPLLELTADTGKVWVALRPPNGVNPPTGLTTLRTILAHAGAHTIIAPLSVTTITGRP